MDGISALRKKLFQLLDSEWKLFHCSNIDEDTITNEAVENIFAKIQLG